MKILQINTLAHRGGAAHVARDLHLGFNRDGHTSYLATTQLADATDNQVKLSSSKDPSWRKKVAKRLGIHEFLLYQNTNLFDTPEYQATDIIQLHNLHGWYFHLNHLKRLYYSGKPIFWTLHDMWALTGHCAYSQDCTKWKTNCLGCPYLQVYPELKVDIAFALRSYKKHLYNQIESTIICPSKWLYTIAQESILSKQTIVHIPNGVDIKVYQPKQSPRTQKKKLTVLFLANGGIDNFWKGGDHFKKIVKHFEADNRLQFINVGGNKVQFESKNLEHIPYINSVKKKVSVYQQADIMLMLSKAENMPLNVLESMACGTPIVGYTVGGVGEVVTPKTGFPLKKRSVAAVITTLAKLKNQPQLLESRSQASSRLVQRKYSLQQQAESYLQLYEQKIKAT